MTERSWTKCGMDWVFCDKDCSSCGRCNYTITDRAEVTIKDGAYDAAD